MIMMTDNEPSISCKGPVSKSVDVVLSCRPKWDPSPLVPRDRVDYDLCGWITSYTTQSPLCQGGIDE